MLSGLVGNEGLKAELSAALAAGRLPHSLILVGEAGCGAGFAARCLAADLLYPGGGSAAENIVQGAVSRILVDEDKPDKPGYTETGKVREALEVRPSGTRQEIRIGQARQVRTEAARSSLSASGRAFLVYGADAINANAANALLKVVEEPPQGVTFLFTARGLAGILPTIRSRSAVYTLSPVSEEAAARYVRGREPAAAGQAERLARVFAGRIGSCLAALQPQGAERLAKAGSLYKALAAGREYEALCLLAETEQDAAEADERLGLLAELAAAGLRHPGFVPAGDTALSPAGAAALLRLVQETRGALTRQVYRKLVLTRFGARAAAVR